MVLYRKHTRALTFCEFLTGAYGLHLDATCAVPRAVTVLHYLNDVPLSDKGPGFGGETWLPLANGGGAGGKPVPGTVIDIQKNFFFVMIIILILIYNVYSICD